MEPRHQTQRRHSFFTEEETQCPNAFDLASHFVLSMNITLNVTPAQAARPPRKLVEERPADIGGLLYPKPPIFWPKRNPSDGD